MANNTAGEPFDVTVSAFEVEGGLIRYDVRDYYLDRQSLSATRSGAFDLLAQSFLTHEQINRILAACEASPDMVIAFTPPS
jgi:hypothetical protein